MIDEQKIKEIIDFLNIEFSNDKRRLKHILSMQKMAVELAEIYNVDIKKAKVSALLHDSTKNFLEDKHISLALKNFTKIKINDLPKACLHAFSASQLAKEKFNITDTDILNAIAYHCCGRKEMSRLEQIIFISDYIEETREFADDKLRKLAKINLDKATYEILRKSIKYLKLKKRPIANLSIEALSYYKNKTEEINER
ncbi:MAG: bis(5'-nucleosyl)-tetraphosphatase (symmetrical) YqeK [Bacillota bacterium]